MRALVLVIAAILAVGLIEDPQTDNFGPRPEVYQTLAHR